MKSTKSKIITSKIIGGRRFYSTSDVLHVFDLEQERFRKWIAGNYIKPDIRATGTGSTHYFEREHIYAIGLFMKLVDIGMNRQIASEMAYDWNWEDWEYVRSGNEDFYLIAIGDVNPKKSRNWKKNMKIFINDSPKLELTELAEKEDFELAIIVNLYKIAKFVDKKLT